MRKLKRKLIHFVEKVFCSNFPDLRMKNYNKISGEKWLDLKSSFEEKRCFIIGSAPSIKTLDLTKLNSEYTFTCNRGYLLKDLGLQKSKFYTIADIQFYKNFKANIDKNFAEYFFISTKIPWDKDVENLLFYRTSNRYMSRGYFQLDMQKSLAVSGTVVLDILQIAVYLGFKEIIFIGVDLNFSKNNLHFYKSDDSELKRSADAQDAELILQAFKYATEFLKRYDVKLYNASPEGNLNCMPKIKYESIFDFKQEKESGR
jgi:hypothetical protein